MRPGRVWAIARKQFLTLRHDPRSIGLILVAPVLAMVVFGFAFGTEVSHVPVEVVNRDEGEEAAAFIALLDREALDVHEISFETGAFDRVTNAQAVAAIVFPENFSAGVAPQPPACAPGTLPTDPPACGPPGPPSGTAIRVRIDESNAQQAAVVMRELAAAAQAYAESKGDRSPIAIQSETAYAKDARFIDFFVPGVMGFAALILTTILTLLAFIGERTGGTLDRLRVTPATEGEIVAGNVLAFGIIGAAQGIVLLAAAILLFKVLVVGNVLLAGLVVVLLAVDSQAIGILASSLARREAQAIMMFPLIVFPTMLLSGIFLPTEALPGWLRPFAYLLPPTWAVEALRDVMLRGWGLDRVGFHLLVLLGFAVGFTLLAVLGLKAARRR